MTTDEQTPLKPRLTLEEYVSACDPEAGYDRPISTEIVDLAIMELDVVPTRTRLIERGVAPDPIWDILIGTYEYYLDPESLEGDIEIVCFQLLNAILIDKKAKLEASNRYVREGHLLSPTTLARITLAMLETIKKKELQVPFGLLSLIQLQMDTTLLNPNPRSRKEEQQTRAIWEKRRNPKISSRALASLCGVHQSTISRWQREDWFKKAVARNKR